MYPYSEGIVIVSIVYMPELIYFSEIYNFKIYIYVIETLLITLVGYQKSRVVYKGVIAAGLQVPFWWFQIPGRHNLFRW